MTRIISEPVGFVVNGFNDPVSHHEIKKSESVIIVDKKYAEGLLNIENCEYLDIIFHFHRSEGYDLVTKTHSGNVCGVFASRSPHRPNFTGTTTVRLLKRENNKLIVQGLDAINKTPVIDIKCTDTSMFASEYYSNPQLKSKLKSDPRTEIVNNIISNNTEALLLGAGQLHGHFCPGLAKGVIAATYAMNQFIPVSDGLEDLLAITETNNCFADGVQYVTGCSFGNNSLIYKDLGKTAFTLTKRDGKGIRICSRPKTPEETNESGGDFNNYFKKVIIEQDRSPRSVKKFKQASYTRAFDTLSEPAGEMFEINYVEVDIPNYAKIDESVVCSTCHESVMKSRTVNKNGSHYCFRCSNHVYSFFNGNGIHTIIPAEKG
ncbi:MAG: TrmO family methyltransferase [Bacteroidales bacterium]